MGHSARVILRPSFIEKDDEASNGSPRRLGAGGATLIGYVAGGIRWGQATHSHPNTVGATALVAALVGHTARVIFGPSFMGRTTKHLTLSGSPGTFIEKDDEAGGAIQVGARGGHPDRGCGGGILVRAGHPQPNTVGATALVGGRPGGALCEGHLWGLPSSTKHLTAARQSWLHREGRRSWRGHPGRGTCLHGKDDEASNGCQAVLTPS